MRGAVWQKERQGHKRSKREAVPAAPPARTAAGSGVGTAQLHRGTALGLPRGLLLSGNANLRGPSLRSLESPHSPDDSAHGDITAPAFSLPWGVTWGVVVSFHL